MDITFTGIFSGLPTFYRPQLEYVNNCIFDLLCCSSLASFHNVWIWVEVVHHVLAEVHVKILEEVGGRFMP